MATSLDDILPDGDDPSVSTEQAAPIETGQQAADPVVADEGQPSAEAEPSDDEPKGWQYAAYKDEKTKRQELEKQAADFQRQLERERQERLKYEQFYQQQQQVAAQQDPRIAAQQQQDYMAQMAQNARLDASEINARGSHGDEVVDAALQALQASPEGKAAYQTIMSSKHPWDAMVKWHKKQETLTKLGDDPDAFIQSQVDAQVQAKLAELQGVQPAQGKPGLNPSTMPTDLSQNRNVGARSASNWSGPVPLENIFKD